MVGEMSKELIISPRSELLREELAEADAWSSYAAELREVLGEAIAKCDVDALGIDGLMVNEPMSDMHIGLYNGAEVRLPQAMDLVEGMVGGRGPYCQLSVPGWLQIESGWDGAVHLFTTPALAAELARLRCRDVVFRWRDATPDVMAISNPVAAVADENFWKAVAKVSDRFTLLCERWAYGAYGCTWFRVTRENVADLPRLMRPRSLVCVASDPPMQPRPELLEDDFTAFVAPVLSGDLLFRAYPGGADTLTEVTSQGFSLMLADSVMGGWCAVTPDVDGVTRASWSCP